MSSVRREADVSAETSTVRPGDFIVYIIIIFLIDGARRKSAFGCSKFVFVLF